MVQLCDWRLLSEFMAGMALNPKVDTVHLRLWSHSLTWSIAMQSKPKTQKQTTIRFGWIERAKNYARATSTQRIKANEEAAENQWNFYVFTITDAKAIPIG